MIAAMICLRFGSSSSSIKNKLRPELRRAAAPWLWAPRDSNPARRQKGLSRCALCDPGTSQVGHERNHKVLGSVAPPLQGFVNLNAS
jgi:hypothetical protein